MKTSAINLEPDREKIPFFHFVLTDSVHFSREENTWNWA